MSIRITFSTRKLGTVGKQLASVGGIIFLLAESFGFYELRIFGALVSGVGVALTAYAQSAREAEQQEEIEQKEAEVERIEAESDAGYSVGDRLKRHIRLAIGRQEIAFLQAERRSRNLYSIGSTLLIVSVLCPVVAGFAYWWIDPLPTETIQRLAELGASLGGLPEQVNVSANRDWRILVGGITFGFLCLAAAKGVLTQQGKEVVTYFRLADRVNYYERLMSVVEIEELGVGEEGEKTPLVELVKKELLSVSGLFNYSRPEKEANDSDKSERSFHTALQKILDERA